MASIGETGEFGLIDSIKRRTVQIPGLVGIGDDCAVIPQKDGLQTLVSTDMLMDGVHFLMSEISPFDLGWKSAAVNLSDIAAMGGRPVGTFLAFSLPKTLDKEWVDNFMEGFGAVSDFTSTPLLGGDTTSSLDRVCICVTVLGECERGTAKLRGGAQVGDAICVTGNLGDSAAGLKIILGGVMGTDDDSVLVSRHYRPFPRIAEGLILGGCEGVHALMDISDGIGSDLRHIIGTSGVGAVIEPSLLPISDELRFASARYGWDPVDLAVNGGEDYELLFTVDPDSLDFLSEKMVFHRIGTVTSGNDVEFSAGEFKGFTHF